MFCHILSLYDKLWLRLSTLRLSSLLHANRSKAKSKVGCLMRGRTVWSFYSSDLVLFAKVGREMDKYRGMGEIQPCNTI